MSFQKIGAPGLINKITKSESEFDLIRLKIAEENNLIRCKSCNKLISKRGSDGTVDIQHKHLELTAKIIEMNIKCPACQAINNIV